jgi:hypothetical protein
MAVPGFVLLGLIVLLQLRRRRPPASVPVAA